MKQYDGITERQMQIGACLIIALILGGIHLALPGFYSTLITLALDGNVPGLQAYILSYGYLSMAISILMILLTNMTGLPSLPLLIVNGLVFGLIPGIIVSWIGEFLGCTAGFIVMRTVFRSTAERIIAKSDKLSRIDGYSTFRNVFIARALPYTPNVLLTALIASGRISFSDHLGATFLGKLPAVAIEVWLGHDLVYITEHPGRLAVVVLICLAGVVIYRRKNK